MTHEEKVARWLHPIRRRSDGGKDFGVEVGAFKTPVPDLHPFYVDRFAEYAHERVLADYFGDLCALPFRDHSLDYVVASHVIEHVANPVKALWECARVVRHGGIVYLVVPDRRFTFDHTRALTTVEHMLTDFECDTTDSDPTHISDFLDGLDWTRWNPNATPEASASLREQLRATYTTAVAAGSGINIHFHTFEAENFLRLLALMNRDPRRPCRFEVLDQAERFPRERGDGLLVVLRVHKPLFARIAGAVSRLSAKGDPMRALRADARDLATGSAAPAPAAGATPPAPPLLRGCIDIPAAGATCDPRSFRIEGWISGGEAHATIAAVEVWCRGACLGRTGKFFPRPDVNRVLALPADVTPGFRLDARLGTPPTGTARLELRVIRPGTPPATVAFADVRFSTGV